MKNGLVALVVGFLFALGLGLAGMTQPQKIVGFLDVFGQWDPSLLFVMVGGVVVHFLTYKLIRRRPSPLLSPQWHVPTKREVTPALLVGSVLFGVGWGLGGFCPGPAMASLASLESKPLVFVLSMLTGMFVFGQLDRKFNIRK